MSSKKVLFITQGISPYLPEDDRTTIGRFLPQAVQEKGHEIRTFMPRFGSVNERRNQLHEVIRLSGMNLIIDDVDHPLIIKVASIQAARMQVYFIDNDDFFKRKATTIDDNGVEYPDNDERSIFYVRGVLETVKKLRWIPDIIHCHGWMTALTPLYIKTAYADDPSFKNTKVVYSLYKDDFKQPFSDNFAQKLKLEGVTDKIIESLVGNPVTYESLTKFAIETADGIIQMEDNTNPVITEFAKKSNKPYLSYKGDLEASIDDIDKFYDNF